MNLKALAIMLVITQLSMNFISGLNQGYLQNLGNDTALTRASMKVVSDTSSTIAVVNKNLSDQVKLLTGLIDFSGTSAKRICSKAHEPNPAGDRPSTGLLTNNSSVGYKQIVTDNKLAANCLVNASTPVSMAVFACVIFLLIRRIKCSGHFFLLARDGLADAIITLRIGVINAHWFQTNEHFSFTGDHV